MGLSCLIQGSKALPWIYLAGWVPGCVGANGSAATALKAVSTDLASEEGFGKGEFAGWVMNLRALAGSIAPLIYGNFFAWCRNQNLNPGMTWWIAGLIGAVLPQLLLFGTSDAQLTKGAVPAAEREKKG